MNNYLHIYKINDIKYNEKTNKFYISTENTLTFNDENEANIFLKIHNLPLNILKIGNRIIKYKYYINTENILEFLNIRDTNQYINEFLQLNLSRMRIDYNENKKRVYKVYLSYREINYIQYVKPVLTQWNNLKSSILFKKLWFILYLFKNLKINIV